MSIFKNLKVALILNLIEKEEFIDYVYDYYQKTSYFELFFDIICENRNISYNKLYEILDKYIIDKNETSDFMTHSLFIYFINKKFKNWSIIEEKLVLYYDYFKEYLNTIEYGFWSRLNDDFRLRKEGFSGCMNMPKELENYLKSYNLDSIEEETTFLKKIFNLKIRN